MRRYSVFLLAALALIFGTDRWIHRPLKQMQSAKVAIDYPFCSEWESPLQPDEKEVISAIINQPFTYLGKGSQSYVFLSEDRQHVIKFLKLHNFRVQSLLRYLPIYHRKHLARREKLKGVIQASLLGTTRFSQETGALYFHAKPTDEWRRQIRLTGRDGKQLLIDCDTSCFLIQKRADMIYDRISALMDNGNIEQAQRVITSIFQLLKRLDQAGVVDNDPVLRRNFGLIDDQAVQIDIGRMRVDLVGHRSTIPSITAPLHDWLETRYPSLLSHFDEEQAKKSHEI